MFRTDNIAIDEEALGLFAELDEFKGSWRALASLAPERLVALRKVATIESIGSSTRIEGSQLSDKEVEQLLAKLEITSFESRDEQEVAGYAEVMETVFRAWAEIPITENYIKQLHRDLLRWSTKDERHRGEYKTLANSVAAFDPEGKQIAIVFETATPFETPRLMAELVEWTQAAMEVRRLHPLLVVAIFTVVFLEIHPFQDGNGRLSRVLTTLLLLKFGYSYTPYNSLESVIERSKENYYLALRQTQGTIRADAPNWRPWVSYFLRAMQQQKRRLESKVDFEKLLTASQPLVAVQILDAVRKRGRVTMGQAVEETGVSRSTLRDHLRALVEKGQLVRYGKGKGSWYALP
jgi:Fic family protein